MTSRSLASLFFSLFYVMTGSAFAGDHHLGHYYTTTTTTTRTHGVPPAVTTSQPFVMVPQAAQTAQMQSGILTVPTIHPASMPMFSAVPQAAAPTASFFHMVPMLSAPVAAQPMAYVQVQPFAAAAAPTTSSLIAPQLLAPISQAPTQSSAQNVRAALPLFGGNQNSTTSPSHATTNRIFDRLKSFLQANLQHSSAVLFPVLKDVGLKFLQAELAQFGLGGLVSQPHPADVSVIEEMVKKLLGERTDAAAGPPPAGVTNNQVPPSMTFSGPITLQFQGGATINVDGKALKVGPTDSTATTTAPKPGAPESSPNPPQGGNNQVVEDKPPGL